MDHDLQVRLAAFSWLSEQTRAHGDVLPRPLLEAGFEFEGVRVPVIGPQGIFKPRIMPLPLSITTSPNSPYADEFSADELLLYKYRGTDPLHHDNVGLRRVFERGLPLVYFRGLFPGRYLAIWPVYLVADDPATLTFTVAADDRVSIGQPAQATSMVAEPAAARRAYLTATVKVRLHQRSFRERVIAAYREQCAFCRLRHRELLDAAHIVPDSEFDSSPTITNGLALCKLHHAAFDSFMIGVSPDFRIEIRQDILEEEDGPVLQHGFKGLHQKSVILPAQRVNWPNRDFLAWRYERFLNAA